MITIASATSDGAGTLAALVAVGVAVLLLPVGHLWLGGKVNLSDQGAQLATKFGGLLIATIGIQLFANGIKTFFGI